jgi:ubiquinone biosynthesis protein UbiJ
MEGRHGAERFLELLAEIGVDQMDGDVPNQLHEQVAGDLVVAQNLVGTLLRPARTELRDCLVGGFGDGPANLR